MHRGKPVRTVFVGSRQNDAKQPLPINVCRGLEQYIDRGAGMMHQIVG